MSSDEILRRLPQIPLSRRGFLLASAALLAARGLPASADAAGSGIYRGNAARTGALDGIGPKTAPTEKWFLETGSTISATPLVVSSTLFASDLAGTLWAVSADDGREHWRYETGVAIWSAPAISDGVVYVGNEDGVLFALSADTGDKLWDFVTEENLQSSPLAVDQLLYIAGWDGYVRAIDRESGSERWKVDFGSMVETSPTFANGRLYVSTNGVHALDARTGNRVWTFEDDLVFSPSTAVFSDGLLYCSESERLFALDAATGILVWQAPLLQYSFPAPTVGQSLAITASEGFDFNSNQDVLTVHGFDASTGAPIWEYAPADAIWADPVLADGLLYLSDISGGLYALQATDGVELWRYSLETTQTGHLNVSDGTLYVAASNGVVALN